MVETLKEGRGGKKRKPIEFKDAKDRIKLLAVEEVVGREK